MLRAMTIPATINAFSVTVFFRLKKVSLLRLGGLGRGLRRLVLFACVAIFLSLNTINAFSKVYHRYNGRVKIAATINNWQVKSQYHLISLSGYSW